MTNFAIVGSPQPHGPNKSFEVRCWEIQSNGSSDPKAAISHDQPVLCSPWKEDWTVPEVVECAGNSSGCWDLRQQTAAHTQQLPERCYDMSVRHPLMVVATANRNIVVYNLQSPQMKGATNSSSTSMRLSSPRTSHSSAIEIIMIYQLHPSPSHSGL